MKSERTVRSWIKKFRAICETSNDPCEQRMAWLCEHWLVRAVDDVRGWPTDPLSDVAHSAKILRQDLAGQTITDPFKKSA